MSNESADTIARQLSPPRRPVQADGRVHGVVIGCQRQDGRWLCIRRSATVAAPLKVCFPGGTIEAGESQESAAVREMREEVGIDIQPIANVWRWEFPDKKLTLWGWTARWIAGEIRHDPKEVAEVLWLSGTEIVDHADAMPTNRPFVASLESHINAGNRRRDT